MAPLNSMPSSSLVLFFLLGGRAMSGVVTCPARVPEGGALTAEVVLLEDLRC